MAPLGLPFSFEDSHGLLRGTKVLTTPSRKQRGTELASSKQ